MVLPLDFEIVLGHGVVPPLVERPTLSRPQVCFLKRLFLVVSSNLFLESIWRSARTFNPTAAVGAFFPSSALFFRYSIRALHLVAKAARFSATG